MAEFVLITEDCEDCPEDSTESHLEVSASQIRVVIEGTVESLKSITSEDGVNDQEDEGTDMTLKPDENEWDQCGVEEIQVNPDDLLPPVAKLEKYATSEMTFNRQVVVRNLLETLHVVHENQDEVARVIDVMYTISEDFEPSVKSELMEQFPHIAAFCKEHPATLGNVIQKYLVPIILNYLGTENNQVRKTCYSTLLTLVKRRLIDLHNLNERICPLLIHTTEKNQSEEHRTEAILFISKLAVQLGKQTTERLFLSRFYVLCSDESFHVRKACADSFGDIFGVVGRQVREEKLLPKFFSLCKDPVWGVRKACAEVFMPISCICSMDTRHKELANVFISLLCDQSRWVRMASFQTLGPFISTFAKPDKTGLYYTKDGVLTIMDVPNSPLEESEKPFDSQVRGFDIQERQFADSDVTCSNNNSERSTIYFSLDRTDTSNSCDNVVPLCTSENTFSASEVPSISCHSGNFCTVIEVSPNATPPVDSEDNPDSCHANHHPVGNGIDHNSSTMTDEYASVESLSCECQEKDKVISYKYINHNNNSLKDEDVEEAKAFKKLWHETMYGLTDGCASLTNGDISSEIEEEEEEDDSNIKLIENHLDSNSSMTFNTREYESEILSTVTVNGVNISSSVALDGPLNCEALPVVSCNATPQEDSTTSDANSESNFIDSELVLLEPDVESDELQHSTEASYTYEHNDLSEGGCIDVSQSSAIQRDTCDEDIPTSVEEVETVELEADQPVDNESAFNHFQYWRTPLPEIDLNLVNCESFKYLRYSSNNFKIGKYSFDNTKCRRESFGSSVNSEDTGGGGESCFSGCGILMNSDYLMNDKDPCLSQLGKEGEPPPKSFTRQLYSVNDQDIVPPQLLLRYLSMTDVSRTQTVDTDIARHCAYSLPAVALTLGRKFWPCLRETYKTLASDMQGFIMQWKVRRTLASSMHQIAVILGPEITARDLVPIFSGFIKDLDEVRIGILQHISEFIEVLRIEERRHFLPQLPEFLNTDNERNWRFRLILAEQMIPIADLYNPEDVRDHLVPLSLALVWDKVSEVRMAAVRVVAVLMRRMSESPTQAITKCVLTDLAEKFIHAPKWLHRQIYVYLCQEFITEESLPPDQFAEDAMPHLLYLCWDRVPNVRIAIARCLAAVMWPVDTFSNPDSPHRELLLQTIHTLQSDVDADVRYYANMVSTHECTCLQHSELNDLTSESFI